MTPYDIVIAGFLKGFQKHVSLVFNESSNIEAFGSLGNTIQATYKTSFMPQVMSVRACSSARESWLHQDTDSEERVLTQWSQSLLALKTQPVHRNPVKSNNNSRLL